MGQGGESPVLLSVVYFSTDYFSNVGHVARGIICTVCACVVRTECYSIEHIVPSLPFSYVVF
jgi:hypothetical protein